ncbi:MAG TPA: S9 family peptidase [Streptosporangiaceae bacterium]|jgi:dipeptidyl aminopeptidase/acylaminoacyl peptidase
MKPADIELFHVLGKPTISPDGRFAVVAVTRPDLDCDEYRGQLWIVPTDGSAQPRPFTAGWRDSAPAYSPDGNWLAFLRAAGEGGQGNATKPQLYVMPTAGGEPKCVTDHPLGAGAPVWSPDSGKIAYLARVPDEGRYGGKPDAEPPRRITTLQFREDNLGFYIDRRSHVFVVEPFGADDPQPVQVTSGDFDHNDVAWSHDGQHLAFASARHDTRDIDLVSDVWLCALDGSQLRPVTRGGAGEGPRLSISSVRVAPDGATICLAATEFGADGLMTTGGNAGVWSVPSDGSAPPARLTDAETIHLAPDTSIEATPDGVLACVERRGAVELVLVPYKNNDHQVESFAGGDRQFEGFAWSQSMLVAAVADPASRGELIALQLPDRTERQLTSLAAIPARPMQEITTTAPDGYPVHGWIVRPEGEGPHPVLLMIHGGPHTQFGLRLHDETQVYVGAGYAVILGNPRGSSGYGETHGKWVAGDAARPAAADLLALLDAGLATGGLDSSRVGVLGGSYGGYMTTWLSAHHGDRFKAAISERAVNAIDSFEGSSDIGWFFAAALWGKDPAGWTAQNPLSFADQISLPMLIIHSENDWRCPVEQAQRLYVALKLRGVPTEMLLFPGEGHGLTRTGRPSHRAARFDAVLDWWARYL